MLRWKPRIALGATTLLLLVVGACYDEEYGVACLASVEPAIRLEIRDSLTGAPKGGGAVARVLEGGFSDTLYLVPFTDSISRQGPDERAGLYDLTVTAPGYLDWALDDILVEEDVCHVHTVRLDVWLQAD